MRGVYGWLFGALFIVGGLFSLALGLREHLCLRRLERRGTRTTDRARAIIDADDNVTLEATFVDELGHGHRTFSRGGSTDWLALDGKDVEILYEPGRPREARMTVDLRMRRGQAVYVFGCLYIGIGGLVIVLHLLGIAVVEID